MKSLPSFLKHKRLPLYFRGLLAMVLVGSGSTYAVAQVGLRNDFVSNYLFEGLDESTFKQKLDSNIALRIDRISAVVELSAEQLSALRLAVKGDLSRFYRELAKVRAKTKDLDMQKPMELQQGWTAIAPLQRKVTEGLIGTGSLFEKVLESTLTDEQSQKYKNYLDERRKVEINALLRATVSDLEKSIPLLHEQRVALVDLLESQKFPRQIPQGFESYVGYAMLSKTNLDQLSTILDEQQKKAFSKMQKQYAGYARSIQW